MDDGITPMMKQYLQSKAEIPPDCILLFRMGDFYEVFFEDAKKAAPLLDVALTKRAGVPMCGVPYHALDSYLPRLVESGVKVAIAEQMEDPRFAKGIVKRQVTRIITPGTVMDSAALSPRQNNYLAALACGKDVYGLASLDISTGELKATELSGAEELQAELCRIGAPECIIPETKYNEWNEGKNFPRTAKQILWTAKDDWIFGFENAEEFLKRHFGVISLDGFGCGGMTAGIAAAGAILHYASENLKQPATHVKSLSVYRNSDFVMLDHISQRNLELVEPMPGGRKEGSLMHVLDHTSTPMGGRRLRDWILHPLRNKDAINARLDAVEALKDDPLALAELAEMLSIVRDMERITARINVGSANARDMLNLSQSLKIIPGIKALLADFETPLICEIRSSLKEHAELADEIDKTIVDEPPAGISEGGIIRHGFSSELDTLRRASVEGKQWIAELQAKEQERAKIKSLKVRFNKVFGYYIEISKSYLSQVPQDYIRKQTLVNAERFVTPELKDMENKILGAEDKAKALELQIFQDLREKAKAWTASILATAAALASLDALSSLAECARKYKYARPAITEDETLLIKAGRHPVLDAIMSQERFVPNDTCLDGDENIIMIITGPNMAGKSTYIRQVALLTLLAHVGSFIPAESATIGLVDRIFTRVGAVDDISRGQSTFMVEMLETANILNNATSKSLVILDEIGRGTSTFDGISIAWAIAEFLHGHPGKRARTLFATHYHELTELALTCKGVKNYNVAVKEYGDQVIFLRQIVPGGTDKSYGIHVAKLAGLPGEVIERAKEILDNLESSSIGEAGQPVLAKRTKTAKPGAKKDLQPTLFDWLEGKKN